MRNHSINYTILVIATDLMASVACLFLALLSTSPSFPDITLTVILSPFAFVFGIQFAVFIIDLLCWILDI